MDEKYPDDLGALWLEHGPRGDYMTGTVSGVKVVCWPVENKTGKQPDWRVKRSKPRADTSTDPAPPGPVTDDQIPF